MATSKKATKPKDDCEEIIKLIEKYRTFLYENKKLSPTKFMSMQTALHGAKNLVRDYFGKQRKGDVAWVKH